MIPLPHKPKIVEQEGNRAVFEIEGLYPGYGHTIGNSLRRVLLSSLRGAVITSVKIDGVGHEFSVIEGVREDIIELMLNLKQLRFRMHEENPVTITLSKKGEGEITGNDFSIPTQAELVTPDLYIATLTAKNAVLQLEATVEAGLGYVSTDTHTKEKVPVGTISLDASFSPVRHVNYDVENMRVGDRTDYNRVRLSVETDGSLTPMDAFAHAAGVLVGQFDALSKGFASEEPTEPSMMHEDVADIVQEESPSVTRSNRNDAAIKIKLDELPLSSRVLNALHDAGIKTVGGVSRKREDALLEIGGLGEKGIHEIKKALGNLGITLKQ